MKQLMITAMLLLAVFCSPVLGANIVSVTVRADIECLAKFKACGEIFSTSRIVSLNTQHVGKEHLLTTRGWVCEGDPYLVDVDSQTEPAQVGSTLFGYIEFTPIFGTFQGVKGRATGGIPGVVIALFIMPFCDATAC